MQSFDPVSLRLFVAVCQERSIAAAAEREAIVPSAISKRISALEAQTGTQLLKRGRRGVLVTPAGETMWRYAQELLQTMDRMQAELSELSTGIHGHVHLFASLSAIAEYLPEDIGAFVRRYEKVRVSLDERVSSEVVRGIEEGRADIGICWEAADLRRLQSFPYRRDQLAVVVPAGHPLATRKKLRFEETLAFEHVDILSGSIVHAVQQRYAAASGKSLRYRIQVSTFDAACRIVAADLAIAIVPREVTGPFEQALGLTAIPLADSWARRKFVICVRNYEALSVSARLLVDNLTESARSGGERAT